MRCPRAFSVRSGLRALSSDAPCSPVRYSYCWKLQDGKRVLDPTDRQGRLQDSLGLIDGLELADTLVEPLPTTLARINEPPIGSDVNVDVEVEGEQVLFVTNRLCAEGEELFLDYGMDYDRTSYGRAE